jgi:hypothetical protein
LIFYLTFFNVRFDSTLSRGSKKQHSVEIDAVYTNSLTTSPFNIFNNFTMFVIEGLFILTLAAKIGAKRSNYDRK